MGDTGNEVQFGHEYGSKANHEINSDCSNDSNGEMQHSSDSSSAVDDLTVHRRILTDLICEAACRASQYEGIVECPSRARKSGGHTTGSFGNQSQKQISKSQNTSKTKKNSGTRKDARRVRGTDPNDEEDGSSDESQRRLACPYFRHSPNYYSTADWRGCWAKGFPDINKLKYGPILV